MTAFVLFPKKKLTVKEAENNAFCFIAKRKTAIYKTSVMDICLEHSGIDFEKNLYSDDGEDKEYVPNAKYRLCR